MTSVRLRGHPGPRPLTSGPSTGRQLLTEAGPKVRRGLATALPDHLVDGLEVDDVVAVAESGG
ncbi:MAG: hypothetical protein WD638_00035 [Nitriliruptoraceae bacterium]